MQSMSHVLFLVFASKNIHSYHGKYNKETSNRIKLSQHVVRTTRTRVARITSVDIHKTHTNTEFNHPKQELIKPTYYWKKGHYNVGDARFLAHEPVVLCTGFRPRDGTGNRVPSVSSRCLQRLLGAFVKLSRCHRTISGVLRPFHGDNETNGSGRHV